MEPSSATTETRAAFARRLAVEASNGNVRVYLSNGRRMETLASLNRDGKKLWFGMRSGVGLTLHRHAGISFPGLPRSGGTSILWGAARERVRALGKDHRAIELGPVGIYIGRDF